MLGIGDPLFDYENREAGDKKWKAEWYSWSDFKSFNSVERLGLTHEVFYLFKYFYLFFYTRQYIFKRLILT